MKKQATNVLVGLLSGVLVGLAGEGSQAGPTHSVEVSLDEYAILQSAANAGVARYKSWCEFEAKMALGTGGQLVWTITIDNPAVLDVWQTWMAEMTGELVGVVNFNNLTDEAKYTLGVVQSVNRKLAEAKANPIYEPVTLGGVVEAQSASPNSSGEKPKSRLALDEWNEAAAVGGNEGWAIDLAGPLASELTSERWLGKPLLLTGLIKSPSTLEVTRVVEKKQETIEIVTMSQCPFGVNAIKGVIAHLDELKSGSPATENGSLSEEFLGFDGSHRSRSSRHALDPAAPEPATSGPRADNTTPLLEIRYLFYKKPPPTMTDGQSGPPAPESPWWCMHGEGELHENLVQMLIRDRHAEFFFAYLRARLEQPTVDWKTVARLAGLDSDAIRGIESSIDTDTDRDAIIQTEHDYVAGLHGITDGSPTWIWESRVIPDIRRIRRFKDLNLTGGSCAGSH